MNKLNIKRLSFSSILILLIVIATGCIGNGKLKFNEDNAYKHIKELSSDEYQGRLPGTEGHRKASQYIANEFKRLDLTPIGKGYFQEFEDYSPILNDQPTFQVVDDKGNVIDEYSIRDDYTELPVNNTSGGVIEGQPRIINTVEDIEEGNKVILSSKNFNANKDIESLKNLGVQLVISPSSGSSNQEFIKTIITEGDTKDNKETTLIRLLVKSDVYKELVDYTEQGYKIKLDMDLKVNKIAMKNVIGYIPAKDEETEEALIITAHYDHVGYDYEDKIFNGALDNASGVGVLLEVARSIKESGISPNRNIVFVAFDGEESGLKGSNYYIRSRPFDLIGSKVINLDMLGSSKEVDLHIDYLPNSQASKDLVDEVKDIVGKVGESLKINPSVSSDHATFGEKDVPAITLNHPSMENIHRYSDEINNIDKDRLKEPGQLVLSLVNHYGIKATDSINKSTSETQDRTLLFIIVAIILIIIIFLLLLKYRKKKGKPILTIILLIFIMCVILVYNASYEYNDYGITRMVNTDKYKGEPWKSNKGIAEVSNIYDSDFSVNLQAIVDDDKGIAKLKIDQQGKLNNKEYLNLDDIFIEDIKLLNNEVYYIDDNNLIKINEENEEEVVQNNIIGFDIVQNVEQSYIIAFDNENIYLINEEIVDKKNVDGIKGLKAKIDKDGRVHMILEKGDSSRELIYLFSNSKRELEETTFITKIENDKKFDFGIDVGKGYVFIYDNTNIEYGTFNLGARSSNIKSFKELELIGNGGIKVGEDVDIDINKGENKEGQLILVAKGKDKYDMSYIFLRNLFNGKVINKEIIYKQENININKLQMTDKNNYNYVLWMEGEDGEYTLKASSSDSKFGNEEKKLNLFIRIGNIIQNIVMIPVFFVSRIYWLLPGLLILGIYKLFKKDNDRYIWIVISIGLVINILTEIMTLKGNYVFGFSIEYLVVPLFILILTLIITVFYRKETNNKSLTKYFIIFTLINMILLSTLYAPYSLEGGLERLKGTEFFGNDIDFE